ncbi:MAG TPA: RNA polymerase sigma factor [Gammaproteobacteria bacterium]|jgi:RNA polymerase sigma-70 factor (ECF subfamily)|nr:RNA polymerase sigma factor [Gammaproteobacteria bacterium]
METATAMRLTEPEPKATAGEDAALAGRARAGDMRAFEQLYRKHVGRVHAVCLRLAGNRTLAEECTQDAFVKAWESLAGFRGEASFGTWVHRIAVNAVLERHRTQLRQAAWVSYGDEDAMESVPGADADPGHGLDLEQCIAGLPPAARMVFVLFDVEGHTHEEIAGMTGLAVGTSKAHLHRARQILRARLET